MDKIYEKILNAIPDCFDFSFITVKNETVKPFFIDNTSDQSILFKIDYLDTYKFEPNEGVVTKHHKVEIKVKIIPDSATVLVSNAKLTLDDKATKVIKMSCIAKYPYLRISKSLLDFGIVEIGKQSEQELIITNPEKVPAKFTIQRKSEYPGKHQQCFYLSAYQGDIPPSSSFLLTIKYVTVFPSVSSYETYELLTIGGNKMRFSCSGICQALTTYISCKYVSFRSIELTESMTKLIRVYNKSDEPTTYQFFHSNDGAFQIHEAQGIVPAKSDVRVNVTFKPRETMIYYDRVFCLIKNHFLIAVDLYGSCHDLLNKVKILEQKHIDIFRYLIMNGFFFGKQLPGKELEIMENISRTFKKSQKESPKTRLDDDSLFDFTNQTQLHKEMFWDYTSPARLYSVDTDHIDFRFIEPGKVSEPYTLNVFNNSTEKIKVKWILDKPINTSNLVKNYNLFNTEGVIFIISPEEAVINKRSYMEFKVYFKPSKPEFYFFANITCLGSILKSYEKKELSDKAFDILKGKESVAQNTSTPKKSPNLNLTLSSFGYKTNILKSLVNTDKAFDYFDPPVPIKVSLVGHSFPPGTQIFMPMMDLKPEKEIIFPPTSVFQSLYQTLTIQNNSDTPLYYKFSSDPLNAFRVHPKYGLIPSKTFNLVCVEFCPQEVGVYVYPMRIVFNHDNQNLHTVVLHGLCSDPLLEVEGIKDEIYFPPSFVGIKTKKAITLINRSPIKVNVNIQVTQSKAGVVEVTPYYFDLDANHIQKVGVHLCPIKCEEIAADMEILVARIYDPLNELIGVFNPGSSAIKQGHTDHRRLFKKSVKIIGRGADGDLKLDPDVLEFGTVKVGFHKKIPFSIFNPTICNFYIKLVIQGENSNDIPRERLFDGKDEDSSVSLDFREGLINSFCKKDVNVTFKPVNRSSINLKVLIYAQENQNDRMAQSLLASTSFESQKSLKAQLTIKANGDYPLLKIVDVRNANIGTSKLWKNFHVNDANVELFKQLTDEEINFMSNERTNKKIGDYRDKLKCIQFDFGKHLMKNVKSQVDIYLTLKNEGGVMSEFFFKFPDDITIKREIWMDPIEPTSSDKSEDQVLKEKIYEIEPRKYSLEPGKCCNIRFRYNIKEQGDHRLRVIFQIVNGKPLIFELYGETRSEKNGFLEIRDPVLDFHYVPIGYMNHIMSPMEITNVGGMKLKYSIDENDIKTFNNTYDGFEIFKLKPLEGSLAPGDIKHLVAYFRPLTQTTYSLTLPVTYYDEHHGPFKIPITLNGTGYHPLKFDPPKIESTLCKMPKLRVYNKFSNEIIQKCGVSLEEINFGYMEDKPANKTLILYNYSQQDAFTFEFGDSNFTIEDDLDIVPQKGKLEPNSQTLVKMVLTAKNPLSRYEGELEIKINWTSSLNESNQKIFDKESLYIRLIKMSILKELPGNVEQSENPSCSFIETLVIDMIKEIICEKDFDELLCNKLDNQPLSLYSWKNEVPYVTHEEVRTKLISNYFTKALSANAELNSSYISSKRFAGQPRNSSMQINLPGRNRIDTEDKEMFTDQEDIRIQEKYMRELIDKFKYTVPEVNEKLLVVNETSKNVISTILENTVYNIISEAVYGETDLTEKTRIYFFNK